MVKTAHKKEGDSLPWKPRVKKKEIPYGENERKKKEIPYGENERKKKEIPYGENRA